MHNQRTPDGKLLHVQSVKFVHVKQWTLEKRPLVAFEVDRQRKRQRRNRLIAERVQQLDPDIHVAVRLGPGASLLMDRVTPVSAGVEGKNPLRHKSSTPRPSAGQSASASARYFKYAASKLFSAGHTGSSPPAV